MNSNVRLLPDTTVFLSFRLKIGLVVPSSNSGCISWLVSIILKSVSVQTRNSTYVRKYMKHNLVYMHSISLYAWVHSFQNFINLSLQVNIIFPPLMKLPYELWTKPTIRAGQWDIVCILCPLDSWRFNLRGLGGKFPVFWHLFGFLYFNSWSTRKEENPIISTKYHQNVLIIIIACTCVKLDLISIFLVFCYCNFKP